MTIKHTKEADLWPLYFNVGLVLGLEDVENDADPIFVVISYNSLICVCSI